MRMNLQMLRLRKARKDKSRDVGVSTADGPTSRRILLTGGIAAAGAALASTARAANGGPVKLGQGSDFRYQLTVIGTLTTASPGI